MPWTKDIASQAPKIVYTPGQDGPQGCSCVVYDPDADIGKRYIAYFDHILDPAETLEDFENAIGLS